jgi:hypothetical protein
LGGYKAYLDGGIFGMGNALNDHMQHT